MREDCGRHYTRSRGRELDSRPDPRRFRCPLLELHSRPAARTPPFVRFGSVSRFVYHVDTGRLREAFPDRGTDR
jgi:hypothetical protein